MARRLPEPPSLRAIREVFLEEVRCELRMKVKRSREQREGRAKWGQRSGSEVEGRESSNKF